MPNPPVDLRTNLRTNPLGLDEEPPRLSWKLAGDRPDHRQTAWQVRAASGREKLETPDLGETPRETSAAQLDVPYPGKRPGRGAPVWWQVRIWDEEDDVSPWSEPARFEEAAGALPGDASWIARSAEPYTESLPLPCFRRVFAVDLELANPRLYITAKGLFRAWLNGRRIGSDELTPGWTDYHQRIEFLSYDVSNLLQPGRNVLAVVVAPGWHGGRLMFHDRLNYYGGQPALLARLEAGPAEARSTVLATDEQWRWSTGAWQAADLYDGEHYDATREPTGWTSPEFDDSAWQPVVAAPHDGAKLVGKATPPVRDIMRLPARTRAEPAPGCFVYDFGQNLAGVIRLRLNAPRGTRVTLRYAEMLQDDGTLYTENLRSARCTDVYVCSGDGEEVYTPTFTFHGFRYAEVSGLERPPETAAVEAVVRHSEMALTGTWSSSHGLLNRLQENIQWGQRGNFIEVPTDCPQRDERLGWTGDAQVFMPTACYNFDVASFFVKWLRDLADSQSPAGVVPHFVPGPMSAGTAAWGDAAFVCPWQHYLSYGCLSVLREAYPLMKRWIEWQRDEGSHPHLVRGDFGFADWLAVDAVEPGRSPTPSSLIGTAYFARGAEVLARTAHLLGYHDDAVTFRDLHHRIKGTFQREFMTPGGRVASETQTGYLLALGFELVPEELIPVTRDHLVWQLRKRNYHLSTGFVGTPLLCPVLSRLGRTDLAYKVALQEDYPSWLFTVHQGATTMWERWNSYSHADGFGDFRMNSFNHYAYGAIGEWLYGTVLGINAVYPEVGYKRIRIAPEPGGGLTQCEGSLESVRGRIAVRWELRDDATWQLDATVPPNTEADFILPMDDAAHTTVNGEAYESFAAERTLPRAHEERRLAFRTGSGRYRIAGPVRLVPTVADAPDGWVRDLPEASGSLGFSA